MRKIQAVFVLALALSANGQAAEVTHLNKSGHLPDGLPFSEAVRVDDTLFLAGQVGNLPGTLDIIPGGMQAEARQTLQNVGSILEANGLTMRDIVKCTVMMQDMSEWGDFNKVYASFFEPPYPARSAFGASGLALGARVELECIAAFPG